MSAGCLVGTSGFYYEEWRGAFYPDDLPKNRFFEYYMKRFDTVELNSTFYHLPRLKTAEYWARSSPPNFRFSLKAYRGITHYARLKEASGELYRYLHLIKPLKPKLGAILFQLPPSLHKDMPLLEDFLAVLPRGYRYAVEFRHESWLTDATCALLQSANVALCVSDFGKRATEPAVTADFAYLRFHGPDGRYGGSYDDATLRRWAEWIEKRERDGIGVYAYFNNDREGNAVRDALRLRELIGYNSQKKSEGP